MLSPVSFLWFHMHYEYMNDSPWSGVEGFINFIAFEGWCLLFIIMHTFCASQDTQISYEWCLL